MQIDRLETHDRLLELKKTQTINISQGAEDCLKKNNLSLRLQQHSPYVYLFAHPRSVGHDEKVSLWSSGQFKSWGEIPEKVMFWQPRLTKPKAQTNSYLFRAKSNTDIMEICWLLPPEETWTQYKKGNVTENAEVIWSINQYRFHRKDLEQSFSEDLSDEQCKNIYIKISSEMDEEKRMKSLYSMPKSEEVFSPSSDSPTLPQNHGLSPSCS